MLGGWQEEFDSFMCGGTTLLAAAMEGYDSVGIELGEAIYKLAAMRVEEAKTA